MVHSFNIPFARFSGQTIKVARFGPIRTEDGFVVKGAATLFKMPGRIQPESNLNNVRSMFGDNIQAAISINSPRKYSLNIKTEKTERDYIFYRNSWWGILQSIHYEAVIPHNEASAGLITHPSQELKNLTKQAEAL